MTSINPRRTLNAYFESVWLPENRKAMSGSLIGAVRKTVSDFVSFIGSDPYIDEVDDNTLDAYVRYTRSLKVLAAVAAYRRKRISDIVRHATPEAKKEQQPELPEPGEGTLRQYVRTVVPVLKPDARKYYLGELVKAVDQFTEAIGNDIAVADVSPDMVAEFAEGAERKWIVVRLRSVMRTFDPVAFRQRHNGDGGRLQLDRGNGSEFLIANVYINHYEPTALRSRRPNTKRLYKTTLLAFDRFLKRSATLDDLTDETVAKFAAWRLKTVCKYSVNKDLFNLLALWRWCNRKGFVETWPDVQMETPIKRTPIAWTEADLRRLFKAFAAQPGRIGKIRACDWWTALLLVAWDSGERIGAILALTWDRVDTSSRWVYFRAEERKGGSEDSAVQLSADAMKAIRKIHGDGEAVFPWPFSYTYLWYLLGKILRDAGLPSDCKSKFHRIRKSVASHAEAAGGNATAMLRHSKREITQAYLDPKIVKQQQPADVLFRLAK